MTSREEKRRKDSAAAADRAVDDEDITLATYDSASSAEPPSTAPMAAVALEVTSTRTTAMRATCAADDGTLQRRNEVLMDVDRIMTDVLSQQRQPPPRQSVVPQSYPYLSTAGGKKLNEPLAAGGLMMMVATPAPAPLMYSPYVAAALGSSGTDRPLDSLVAILDEALEIVEETSCMMDDDEDDDEEVEWWCPHKDFSSAPFGCRKQ